MKILISGASGFIGKVLSSHLQKDHEVFVLVRNRFQIKNKSFVFWDVDKGVIETEEEMDVIINLAGENIFSGSWTEEKKQHIISSRLKATNTLVKFALQIKKTPTVFLSASAIGFYGFNPEKELTEESKKGEGFLADVCERWEEALLPLQNTEIKTLSLRFGAVLGKEGGILKEIRKLFRFGLGATLGSGEQWLSWISLVDLVRAVTYLLQEKNLTGPINIVSPHPVTNREFTQSLAKALHRSVFFSIPKWLIQLIFGQMGTELLLASQKVLPKKLEESGFSFEHPCLEQFFYTQYNSKLGGQDA